MTAPAGWIKETPQGQSQVPDGWALEGGSSRTPDPQRSLVSRVGSMLAGLPSGLLHLPQTIAGNALDTFFTPVQGTTKPTMPGRGGWAGGVRPADAGAVVTPENTPGSITPAQAVRAGINTAAVAGAPLLPGGLLGRLGVNTTLGALNAPSDPVAGGVTGLLAGEGLHGAARLAGTAAKPETDASLRMDDAQANQVPLTVGQATGSGMGKLLETGLFAAPTGRGVMAGFATKQAEAASNRAQTLAEQIAGDNPIPSREGAGQIAIDAANRIGDQFEKQRRPLSDQFKAQVDAAHPDGIDLPSMQDLFDQLSEKATTKPGAYSKTLAPVLAQLQGILSDAKGGKLDAADLLRLRTDIGNKAHFSSPLEKPDPAKTYFNQAYGALSDDIKEAANNAGPDAEKTLADHDALVKGFRKTNNPAGADFWDRVANAKSPGQAFDLVTKNPHNATAQSAIRDKMLPSEYQPLAARHFLDLGDATPGAQNSEGSIFSPSTALTRWNGTKNGFTPEVRSALYGSDNMPALDQFARTLGDIKSSGPFANPSGTSGATAALNTVKDAGKSAAQLILADAGAHQAGLPHAAVFALSSLLAPYLGAEGATSQKLAGFLSKTPDLVRPKGLLSDYYQP